MVNQTFLDACAKKPTSYTPVWFMRQAGRALPEYRELRGADSSILDAIKQPDLAIELTAQPVRRYGVDAAILFSDIMVPLHAIGFGIDIVPGVGPVANEPFRTANDLTRLRDVAPAEDMGYVWDTIIGCRKELDVPLIGFTGAPFTLASYIIEGQPTRTWVKTKQLMHGEPTLWHALMDRLTQLCISTLRFQVEAGAQAIQLFDSWVGALSRSDFDTFVRPYVARILETIDTVPTIYFGTDTAHLLPSWRDLPVDVIGVDWRLPIGEAWEIIGADKAIQGNLDPVLCTWSYDAAAEETRSILDQTRGKNGHIFNLGHGVLPETDPGVLEQLVAFIHTETAR